MEKLIEIIKEKKQIVLITAITVLLISIQTLSFFYLEEKIKENKVPEIKIVPKEETKMKEEFLYVDIKGEIKKPGIYKLEKNKRIIDVIHKAGGLTKDANTSANNLSKKITDEMVIIIYSNDQIANYQQIKKEEEQVQINCNKEEKSIINNSCIEKAKDIDEKAKENNENISINNATKEQLMTLPGIGESKADNIIEYRKNTKFETIEDIKEVSGIGEALFTQIKDKITI